MRLAAFIAIAASAGLHVAGFSVVGQNSPVEEAGGAPVASLALGNSFQDMVAGAPTPVTPPVSETAARVTPPVNAAVSPQATAAVKPPVDTATAVPSPVADSATPETVTGVTPPDPAPKAKPETPRRPVVASGAAEADSRKGKEDGSNQGQATETAKAQGKSPSSGSASAANYPGIVMKHLRRAKKDRLNASGKAVVAFSIASSGALAKAQIVKSSGNAALDAAALAYVGRAAPFPPPPPGAEQRFSFEFASR